MTDIANISKKLQDFWGLNTSGEVLTSRGAKRAPNGQAAAGGGGSIVQQVFTESGEVATGSTVTPRNDTIPQQSTETTIFFSQAITPNDASNLLIIEGVINLIGTSGDVIICLFQDSIEDALKTWWDSPRVNSNFCSIPFRTRLVAGSTDPRTYKIGFGPTAAATITINGFSGARNLGGTLGTNIMVTEITPPTP